MSAYNSPEQLRRASELFSMVGGAASAYQHALQKHLQGRTKYWTTERYEFLNGLTQWMEIYLRIAEASAAKLGVSQSPTVFNETFNKAEEAIETTTYVASYQNDAKHWARDMAEMAGVDYWSMGWGG